MFGLGEVRGRDAIDHRPAWPTQRRRDCTAILFFNFAHLRLVEYADAWINTVPFAAKSAACSLLFERNESILASGSFALVWWAVTKSSYPSKTMKLKTIAIVAVAASTVLCASTSEASSRSLVQQSHQLESVVSELRTEFREHYDHTSVYRHLINDVATIEREVEHMHSLAHSYSASYSHIMRDLEQIDALAHHIHEMVDAADRGRHGHVHGDTRHVHSLLSSLNDLIHSMQRTVRSDSAHGHSGQSNGHGSHNGQGYGQNSYNDHGRGHSSARNRGGDRRAEGARGMVRGFSSR